MLVPPANFFFSCLHGPWLAACWPWTQYGDRPGPALAIHASQSPSALSQKQGLFVSHWLWQPSSLQCLTPAGLSLSLGLPLSFLHPMALDISLFPGKRVKESSFRQPLHATADDSVHRTSFLACLYLCPKAIHKARPALSLSGWGSIV